MNGTEKRLDLIYEELTSDRFVQGRGKGNELGFWVFDYPPEDELLVREHLHDHLLPRLAAPSSPHRVVHVDLYEFILEVLDRRGKIDDLMAMEEKEGYEAVHRSFVQRGLLVPEKLARRICQLVEPDHTLLIMSGIGKAYPLVRSHTILNNLHDPLGSMAVLLMFPGVYDQRELSLFGRLKDDNYYRAFRLVGDL